MKDIFKTNGISLDEAGVGVHHHFCAGLYAKETFIPAGVMLSQHKHCFDHLSILASGSALVEVDGEEKEFFGPCVLEIKANKEHCVTAITDVVWYCLHATEETDPDKIDHELIHD